MPGAPIAAQPNGRGLASPSRLVSFRYWSLAHRAPTTTQVCKGGVSDLHFDFPFYPGSLGILSALSVLHSKSDFYGAFVWAQMALTAGNDGFRYRAVARGDRAAQPAGSDHLGASAGLGRIAALHRVESPRCTVQTAHPRYTRFTKRFGTSVSETAMRDCP